MKNYHAILGVTRQATDEEIKKSYRKLAMQFHPDRNKDAGAEDKFKEITEAYEVLSDKDKREAYENPPKNDGWQRHEFTDFDRAGEFADLFRQFNARQEEQRSRRQSYTATISLEQAYTGCTISVGTNPVRIPAGIRSGNRMYVNGALVAVEVTPHPKFKRSNDDLLLEVTINAFEAILGVEVEVKHINGNKLKFKFQPGTQVGQVIKLAGKGMPNPEVNRHGDLLVKCNVTIPKLSDSAREALAANYASRKIIEL
jgi:DnaJ-class molecular chaperone